MRYTISFKNYNDFMNFGGWILIFVLFIGFISLIFKIVSRWIFFKKCGEAGWKALIPIYTDVTLVKISSLNWWWVLLLYVSVIPSIFSLVVYYNNLIYLNYISAIVSVISLVSLLAKINIGYNVCKKFNISMGYAVLIALLEPIGLLIIGLSKNMDYDKEKEVSLNGFINSTQKSNNYNSTDIEFCEKCGNKINKDSIYCEHCGNKVK